MSARPTHGATRGGRRAPEYVAWRNMFLRCENPRAPRYPNYGGRGIRICERWQSFENFLADMGPRPSPDHSLDRKNNDGNYEPDNCRWATRSEQQNNTRHNLERRFDAETLLKTFLACGGRLRPTARALGVDPSSVKSWITRSQPRPDPSTNRNSNA